MIKGYGVIVSDEAQDRRMYGLWDTPADAELVKKALEAETPWPWAVAIVSDGED